MKKTDKAVKTVYDLPTFGGVDGKTGKFIPKAVTDPRTVAGETSEARDALVMADMINQARTAIRLAEFKAVDLRFWHTAEDCKNIRASIDKLIASTKG